MIMERAWGVCDEIHTITTTNLCPHWHKLKKCHSSILLGIQVDTCHMNQRNMHSIEFSSRTSSFANDTCTTAYVPQEQLIGLLDTKDCCATLTSLIFGQCRKYSVNRISLNSASNSLRMAATSCSN